ncbi:MAG: orotidine-5'-phosphate decarboxylase [Trueperaceae bacterium]|nr:orotidine-5'-phosphate decarboxylase [Trueperaceae bacterium]
MTDGATFAERVHARVRALGSRVCLGIDPRPHAHPSTHPERFAGDPAKTARAVVAYVRAVLDATDDLIACAKPQSAFFEALGVPGVIALAQVLADLRERGIPAILDAKRGDIGSTAEAYAAAYLADGVFAADALTVNAYLGLDTLEPFLAAALAGHRGLFALVKTSNPGSGDLQDLATEDGRKVHERLADALAARAERLPADADGYTALGAVVGATYPAELTAARARLPRSLLLVPGYGAQGGRGDDVAGAFDATGVGAVVNASRTLLYPTAGDDVGPAARAAALAMRDDLNRALEARGR